MISYKNFWKTLKDKNISQYKLSVYYGISNSQINRIKKGEHITTATLEKLCHVLNCKVEDIITYIPDGEVQNPKLEAVAEHTTSPYGQTSEASINPKILN